MYVLCSQFSAQRPTFFPNGTRKKTVMVWNYQNVDCSFDKINLLCHLLLPSVLWRCWLGGRKGIRPVKKLSGEVLAWLSVWSKVQTCIRPSWCHCHSLSLASVKSRLVLPFWYRPTRVVQEKGPLNGCMCVSFTIIFGTLSFPILCTHGIDSNPHRVTLAVPRWRRFMDFGGRLESATGRLGVRQRPPQSRRRVEHVSKFNTSPRCRRNSRDLCDLSVHAAVTRSNVWAKPATH